MHVLYYISLSSHRRDTALMLAAGEGKTEVGVGLVKAGANVDMQDNVCQCTII